MDTEALLAHRREIDDFFKSHPNSPLTPEQQAAFAGLDWFPPNPALDLTLTAEEFADKAVIMMPRTGDKPSSPYQRWGKIQFEVAGQPVELTLLYGLEHDYFFLGFWDTTSGTETYGGGRYLDPERLADGRFHVDFNVAYNPYCAYNARWSCIIPLPENRLPVRIDAGQKAFHK